MGKFIEEISRSPVCFSNKISMLHFRKQKYTLTKVLSVLLVMLVKNWVKSTLLIFTQKCYCTYMYITLSSIPYSPRFHISPPTHPKCVPTFFFFAPFILSTYFRSIPFSSSMILKYFSSPVGHSSLPVFSNFLPPSLISYFSLSFSPSFYLSIYISIFFYSSLFLPLSISLSPSLSISLTLSLSSYLSLSILSLPPLLSYLLLFTLSLLLHF